MNEVIAITIFIVVTVLFKTRYLRVPSYFFSSVETIACIRYTDISISILQRTYVSICRYKACIFICVYIYIATMMLDVSWFYKKFSSHRRALSEEENIILFENVVRWRSPLQFSRVVLRFLEDRPTVVPFILRLNYLGYKERERRKIKLKEKEKEEKDRKRKKRE